MYRTENITELEALAASQWGMFTSAQAQEVGIRRNQILRMLDANRVERMLYGAYRFTSSAESENAEVKAAWLSVYPKKWAGDRLKAKPFDAVVAGTTAAFLLDAGNYHASPYTFILRQRKQTSRKDIRFLFCKLDEEDVIRKDGLPVTSFERTVYDLLRLNEDPDLIDKFIQDASREQLHVFDDERLATLLTPLAARYGFDQRDGESFAADLINRNASTTQFSRLLGNPSRKISTLLPPSVLEGMKTAFDDSEVMARVFRNSNLTNGIIHTLADSDLATRTLRDTMNKITLSAISQSLQPIHGLDEISKQIVKAYSASMAGLYSDARNDVDSEEPFPPDTEEDMDSCGN